MRISNAPGTRGGPPSQTNEVRDLSEFLGRNTLGFAIDFEDVHEAGGSRAQTIRVLKRPRRR